MSGTWGEKLDGAVFYVYKFDFSCDIVTELYSGFILLIESELADDVGNIELELYLVSKRVKASVSSCGQVRLNGGQVHHKFISFRKSNMVPFLGVVLNVTTFLLTDGKSKALSGIFL